mgnify:CR=1 FL=1
MLRFGALAEYDPSRIIEIALSIGMNELIETAWTSSCIPLRWIYGQGPITYSHILGLSLEHVES